MTWATVVFVLALVTLAYAVLLAVVLFFGRRLRQHRDRAERKRSDTSR